MLKLAPLETMPATPIKKNLIHRNELKNIPLSDLRQIYACGEVNLTDVVSFIKEKIFLLLKKILLFSFVVLIIWKKEKFY